MSLLKVHKILGREFQILRLERGSPIRATAPIHEIDEQLRYGTSTVIRLWPTRWAISLPEWTGRHENEDQALAAAMSCVTYDRPRNGCKYCGGEEIFGYDCCAWCYNFRRDDLE